MTAITRLFWIPSLLVFALGQALAHDAPRHLERAWPNTDFSQRTVSLEEIRAGGPSKDGIPALDDPKFVGTTAAARWLEPREPVIALRVGDHVRAYPLQILIWHEIANDVVGGTPVAVTFCPLCNASLVFERRIDGRTLDFGVSGLLRRSDLVMYDRQTESWWQQFTGEGIVGEYAGRELETLPAQIVAFGDFQARFPDAGVLSRSTGHSRAYGQNPYSGYDNVDSNPFMLDGDADPRLPAMERIFGLRGEHKPRVYPFSVLREQPVINDTVGGQPVVVMSRDGVLSVLDAGRIASSRRVPDAVAYSRRLQGRVLTFETRDGAIHDRETGSAWNLFGEAIAGPLKGRRLPPVDGGVHFAFAWLVFHPESEIYGEAG